MDRSACDIQFRLQSPTPTTLLQSFFKTTSIAVATIGVVVLLGWVFDIERFYTPKMGTLLLTILNVVIFAVITLWNARALAAINHLHKQAETVLQQADEELEHEVESRTIQFLQANEQLQCEIDERGCILSERKRAETELRASEERFQVTFNTERQQADEALRESEERYRFLANTMPQIVWTAKPNGGLDYYNQPWYDYTGMTYEQGKNWDWQRMLHPDDLQLCVDRWAKALGVGSTYEIEYRIKRASDGMYRWHLCRALPRRNRRNGEIVQWVGTCTDIHEQKQAEKALALGHEYLELEVEKRTAQLQQEINERKRVEEELRESKLFAESISEYSTSIIYVFDLDTMTNIYSNRDLAQYLGYSREQIQAMGSNFLPTIVHPDNIPHRIAHLEQFKDVKDGEVIEFEQRVKHVSGEWRWICSREVIFKRQPDGRPYQIMGTAQDITERKKAEKQIKDSLQEKEVLLKEIHHRVKNNLQVIESLLRLQSRYSKDENVLDMFKESQNRIKSMALIHEKLYQSKDLARIDFPEYIRSLTASLFRSYVISSANIDLRINLDDVCLKVDTAISCGLIINELVANSLKHAFPQNKKGEIQLYLRAEDKHKIVLIISDNGIGFPKDFDFRNTESLGLQLVTSLAEQLEATIELHSDSRTEFRLSFTDTEPLVK